ncbi:8-oxo-7,8-dihydroguanine DNA N-glycosylase [Aureococcus anophagefferens]|nr:8-oxo-7,8-dihydroguanine DNA N-glycosylase [Aureococcus anophagefferens]
MVRAVSTPWRSLGLAASELKLAHTLPTGQAFGWVRVGDEYHGCLRDAGVALREHPFGELYGGWSRADARFAKIAAVVDGARVLRQDPLECLISFICSSNNNIPRITLMLGRLRELCGDVAAVPGGAGMEASEPRTFPTLERLCGVEAGARDLGRLRAPYVAKTARHVRDKGGDAWLAGLRNADRADVKVALLECAGVGPKVADCVALFSLDQADAVPVDTHVWRIARRDFDPTLDDVASITPKVYDRVGDLFRDRFDNAGWAHTVLFAAELPLFADKLPEDVAAEMRAFRAERRDAADDVATPPKKQPKKQPKKKAAWRVTNRDIAGRRLLGDDAGAAMPRNRFIAGKTSAGAASGSSGTASSGSSSACASSRPSPLSLRVGVARRGSRRGERAFESRQKIEKPVHSR